MAWLHKTNQAGSPMHWAVTNRLMIYFARTFLARGTAEQQPGGHGRAGGQVRRDKQISQSVHI